MDEKFAEMAMEWGARYYDLIRLGKTSELNYEGRTFSEDKTYLPYPQAQIDQIVYQLYSLTEEEIAIVEESVVR